MEVKLSEFHSVTLNFGFKGRLIGDSYYCDDMHKLNSTNRLMLKKKKKTLIEKLMPPLRFRDQQPHWYKRGSREEQSVGTLWCSIQMVWCTYLKSNLKRSTWHACRQTGLGEIIISFQFNHTVCQWLKQGRIRLHAPLSAGMLMC